MDRQLIGLDRHLYQDQVFQMTVSPTCLKLRLFNQLAAQARQSVLEQVETDGVSETVIIPPCGLGKRFSERREAQSPCYGTVASILQSSTTSLGTILSAMMIKPGMMITSSR